MTEDPSKTSRFLRSGKSTLKYGIQAYGPEPNPRGLLSLFGWMGVGVVVLIGLLVWWLWAKDRQQPLPPPVPEVPAVQQEQPKSAPLKPSSPKPAPPVPRTVPRRN
jgi:hypothetical protein